VQGLTPACDGKPPRLQVDRTRRLTAASLEDPAYDILYGAPALIVICATSAEQQAAEDCALAAQNGYWQHTRTRHLLHRLGTTLAERRGRQASARIPGESVPFLPIIVGQQATILPSPGRHAPQIDWLGLGMSHDSRRSLPCIAIAGWPPLQRKIRNMIGDVDDAVVSSILRTVASAAEVLQAVQWFRSSGGLEDEAGHEPYGAVKSV
jgi:hypothetical protein